LYACVTSVTIILFTTIIFVLYNQAVDSTFTQKDLILQTKRAFMRYISHEIRTPMNIVHLGLKILFTEHEKLLCEDVIQQLPPDTIDKMKDWQELIADIEDSSDAAVLVLTDLINYDKIALGQLELEIRPLNLWDLIDSTCAPFNVQAKQSKVRFSNDFEIKTCESPDRKLKLSRLVTLGDNIKLCQVVRNVVSNAIKFSPVGGQVTVKGRYAYSYVK
jgi:signal transduction histidine kinase